MFLRQGEQCPSVELFYMGYSPPKCTCNGNQTHSRKYMILLECLHDMDENACHTSIPGPTRLANPNRVQGARPYTGTFFFFKLNLYMWVWPTSYNRIQISYTYTEFHSLIQKLYFYIYKSEHGTYCDEPLLVCWPNCMQMFSDVFSYTYTD